MGFVKNLINIARAILLIITSLIIVVIILGVLYDLMNPGTKGLSPVDFKEIGVLLLISLSLLVIFHLIYKYLKRKLS
jgi:hypothetical protein